MDAEQVITLAIIVIALLAGKALVNWLDGDD